MMFPSILAVGLALSQIVSSSPILKRDAKSAAIDALLLNSNIGYEICIIAQETYLAAAALGLANNFDYCVNPLTNIPVQTSVTIIYPPAAQTNLVLTSTSSTVSINPGTVTSLTTTSTTTTTSTSTTVPTVTFTQYKTLYPTTAAPSNGTSSTTASSTSAPSTVTKTVTTTFTSSMTTIPSTVTNSTSSATSTSTSFPSTNTTITTPTTNITTNATVTANTTSSIVTTFGFIISYPDDVNQPQFLTSDGSLTSNASLAGYFSIASSTGKCVNTTSPFSLIDSNTQSAVGFNISSLPANTTQYATLPPRAYNSTSSNTTDIFNINCDTHEIGVIPKLASYSTPLCRTSTTSLGLTEGYPCYNSELSNITLVFFPGTGASNTTSTFFDNLL